MNYPDQVTWLKKNKDALNLKYVAEQIGIPVKNLWNYCNNVHSLNEKWWAKTVKWVNNLKAD